MREVVFIDGVRPHRPLCGRKTKVRPDDLLAYTYKALIGRAGADRAQNPWVRIRALADEKVIQLDGQPASSIVGLQY